MMLATMVSSDAVVRLTKDGKACILNLSDCRDASEKRTLESDRDEHLDYSDSKGSGAVESPRTVNMSHRVANREISGSSSRQILSLCSHAWGDARQIYRTRIASQWYGSVAPVYFRFNHHVLLAKVQKDNDTGWTWESTSDTKCIEIRPESLVVDITPSPFMPFSEIILTNRGNVLINPFETPGAGKPSDECYDPLASNCLNLSIGEEEDLVSCCYNEHPATFTVASETALVGVDARTATPMQFRFGLPKESKIGRLCMMEKCESPSHGIVSIHSNAIALWDTRRPKGFVSRIETYLSGEAPVGYDFNNSVLAIWSHIPGDVSAFRFNNENWRFSTYFEGNSRVRSGSDKQIDSKTSVASSPTKSPESSSSESDGSSETNLDFPNDREPDGTYINDGFSYRKALRCPIEILKRVYVEPPMFGCSMALDAPNVGGYLDRQGSKLFLGTPAASVDSKNFSCFSLQI